MRKETGRWKSRWRIRDLFADKRFSQVVLDLVMTTDMGRIVPPVEKESDTGSEVSEWELWERREQEEERRVEAEVLGAGEESLLLLPTPPFMASAGEE